MAFGLLAGGAATVFAEAKPVNVKITKFEIQNSDHTTATKLFHTDRFLLKMNWDATHLGANIHEGDYFDVTLPDNMRFPSDTTARDFDLKDTDGTVVAKAHVTPGPNDEGGKIHVTFTNAMENKYNVKGTMYLAAKFAKGKIKYDEKNTFSITVNSDVSGQSHTLNGGVIIQGPTVAKDEYISKWGGSVEGKPNQARWHVRLNHLKANMHNVVITDTMGASGESLIPGSFKLQKVTFDKYGNILSVDQNVEVGDKLKFGAGNKSFELKLGDIGTQQYHLEYDTTYTPGTKLKNSARLTSTEKNAVAVTTYQSADSGGTGSGDLASKIKLKKVDADNSSILLANAVFTVTAPDGSTFDLTTGADGTVTSGVLKQGSYKVKEKTPPVGYKLNGQEFTLKVTPTGGALQTITDKKKNIEISGEKTWNDAGDQDGIRPKSVTVNLLADGKEVDQKTVTAADNWQYRFANLPEYNAGKKIVYTVTENSVSEYNTKISGYDITNSYTPSKTSVTVTKRWDDAGNQDGIRPNSVKVQLYADGQKSGDEVELNSGNNWTTTWGSLPEKAAGKTIEYTVKEVGTVNGYTTATGKDSSNGSIIICNKHMPEKTTISGKKTWDDAGNQDGKRPSSITVNLLANGTKKAEKKVTADNGWKYDFKDLPKYQDGKKIVYTVTENSVSEYNTKICGCNITNSYTPKKTSVTVTKNWNDANNQDGKRPNSVKVQLYANGQKSGDEVELNSGNKWTTTWNNLPEKAAGKTIQYTVKEVGTVSGYTTAIDDQNIGDIRITNSHTPSVTSVSGTKTWNDAGDQDGKRPSSITVNLLADGKKVMSKKVTAADNWQYRFANLPEYNAGKKIVYTVTEDAVKDYSTSIAGNDIVNSYTPKKTSVTVTKHWNDSNNKDKIRPTSIRVQLYADGEKVGDAVKLNADNQWTKTWANLAQKKNGKPIRYTVRETGVRAGYSVSVNDQDHGNIVITNSHTPKAIVPETGDHSRTALYLSGVIASAVALLALGIKRRVIQ
ncbi:putative collagen adhesin [Pseudoramibacter alactolyticus ATCC 23263]|uniref:Putative collagen adhesin n=2 Tax=Pseudoramibacter TaxID=113286 RepID=E6MK72_9FIRM|nr:putative collagen adhesin [Pseudoramibacter alactolyticus ATCC 23263]